MRRLEIRQCLSILRATNGNKMTGTISAEDLELEILTTTLNHTRDRGPRTATAKAIVAQLIALGGTTQHVTSFIMQQNDH